MSNKRKITAKLVHQCLICRDKVTLPFHGESAIESVIDRVPMFNRPLKGTMRESFGGSQRKWHREQVSINKRRFVRSQLTAKYNSLPECAGDFH